MPFNSTVMAKIFSRDSIDREAILAIRDPSECFAAMMEACKTRRYAMQGMMQDAISELGVSKADLGMKLNLDKSRFSQRKAPVTLPVGALEHFCYEILHISVHQFFFGSEHALYLPTELACIAQIVENASDMKRISAMNMASSERARFEESPKYRDWVDDQMKTLSYVRAEEQAQSNMVLLMDSYITPHSPLDREALAKFGKVRITLARAEADHARRLTTDMLMCYSMLSGNSLDYMCSLDYAAQAPLALADGTLIETQETREVISAMLSIPQARREQLAAKIFVDIFHL